MPRINLLPWREELRQERQKQFFTAMIVGLVVAIALFYAALMYADGLIDEQNQRNTFLKKEIALMDSKIAEISTLETERTRLLARMNVIQELQTSRPTVVKVLDALVRTLPDGIHLEKLTREGDILTLNGVAQSNARVSVFMQQLDNNPELTESTLSVIQRTSTNDDAIRKFSLSIGESKVKKEDGER
ncbi:MAG: type IV pilus assembly protein PilN [Methylophagaceae bacterium]|jgi:type IV pilus assembly protein PilN